TSSKITGVAYRITGLNAGVNTITLTATAISGNASFLGWGIEAPQPPLIYLLLDPRATKYTNWAAFSYYTRAPIGTQTATVSAGSLSTVTLGTAITIGTTGTGSSAVY